MTLKIDSFKIQSQVQGLKLNLKNKKESDKGSNALMKKETASFATQEEDSSIKNGKSKKQTESEIRHYENKEQLGMYMRERQDLAWEDLNFKDKARLVNKFSLIAIVGNFFQLLGCVFYYI